MDENYEPQIIEKAAQQYWVEQQSFEVKEDLSKEKFYCLSMLPYPSGDIHMGHVRNYTIGDVIARYQRMLGKHVLHPMGWDAFGLPAENAAIAHQLPPAEWTHKNITRMRKQFEQLGYSFSWRREINTSDPSYYSWEQWLFLQLYKKGLIYKKNSLVNWDPVDQTVLANEQVVDGKGWRSGAPVERREIPQWFFKITAYAEELLNSLDQLDGWPSQVRSMQRHWIGRSEGVLIEFPLVQDTTQKITVFTTRADTLFGICYLAIAAEHPLAKAAAVDNPQIAQFIKQCAHTKVAEADIATQTKEGICLKFTARHPVTHEELPIWVTNYVMMQYGEGAVMAVPAHDQRDFEFAQQYGLPIKPVINPPSSLSNNTTWDFTKAAYTPFAGTLIHSQQFDGLEVQQALQTITELISKQGWGKPQIHYRLRDWGISRQRYWGNPIPMIQCQHCGDVPVPEQDLPVVLPENLIPDGHDSPLKSSPSFFEVNCPQCGQPARRETDTMDTFVESSWYYARYCCVDQDKAMLDDRSNYWTPVDQYVGGVEHAIMHLLYARFMHKVLRDLNLLNSDEPFKRLLTQGMVLKDGHKMSKSKGNVVAPQDLIKRYGADTVRLFIIFAAPPEQALEWSDSGVEGSYRFLRKLWMFAKNIQEKLLSFKKSIEKNNNFSDLDDGDLEAAYRQINQVLQQAEQDMDRLQLNTLVSACMKLFNILSKLETNALDSPIQVKVIDFGMSILLRLLSPIAPHITHELWQQLGYGDDILQAPWPKVNTKALEASTKTLVVQVNGKLRGKITAPAGATREWLEQAIAKDISIHRHIADQPIKKFIIVPDKLVNIVL